MTTASVANGKLPPAIRNCRRCRQTRGHVLADACKALVKDISCNSDPYDGDNLETADDDASH